MPAAGDEAALRARIEAYLAAHDVMTLATAGPDGPWAAAVFYVSDGLTLYFVSAPASRHSRDIEASGVVAAAIHGHCDDWRDIKGIQLDGTASRISGTAQVAAARRYGSKFPVVANLAEAPREIARALAGSAWYRVVPRRIRLIDNSLGLGHKEEIIVCGG